MGSSIRGEAAGQSFEVVVESGTVMETCYEMLVLQIVLVRALQAVELFEQGGEGVAFVIKCLLCTFGLAVSWASPPYLNAEDRSFTVAETLHHLPWFMSILLKNYGLRDVFTQ